MTVPKFTELKRQNFVLCNVIVVVIIKDKTNEVQACSQFYPKPCKAVSYCIQYLGYVLFMCHHIEEEVISVLFTLHLLETRGQTFLPIQEGVIFVFFTLHLLGVRGQTFLPTQVD